MMCEFEIGFRIGRVHEDERNGIERKGMKMKKIVTMAVMALAGGLCGLSEAASFPCGTYVIRGGAKNERGALYDANDNVQVQVLKTNGTVIASSSITDPYDASAGYNFLLNVPLVIGAADEAACVGDDVNLVLKVDGVANLARQPVRILRANGGTNLFVQVWDTISYTNADKSVATLSRRYVEEIQSWVDAKGLGTYNPFADYDGDGRSNYAEYVEGTDPFDPSDYLHILEYKTAATNLHTITFAYSGGRVYGVSSASDVSKPAWLAHKIKPDADSAEQDRISYAGTDEDVGRATLYVVPTEGAESEFFKLEVK